MELHEPSVVAIVSLSGYFSELACLDVKITKPSSSMSLHRLSRHSVFYDQHYSAQGMAQCTAFATLSRLPLYSLWTWLAAFTN